MGNAPTIKIQSAHINIGANTRAIAMPQSGTLTHLEVTNSKFIALPSSLDAIDGSYRALYLDCVSFVGFNTALRLRATTSIITNCRFVTSPLIVSQAENALITNTQFSISAASALVISSYGSTVVRNTTFAKNRSPTNGGAILSNSCGLSIFDSTFSGNQADGAGGALFFVDPSCATEVCVNCTFESNTAGYYGADQASMPAKLTLPDTTAPPLFLRPGERFAIKGVSLDAFGQRCTGPILFSATTATVQATGDAFLSGNDTRSFPFQPDATLYIHDLVLHGKQYVRYFVTVSVTGGFTDAVDAPMTIVRCPPGYFPQEGIDGDTACQVCQDFQYSLDGKKCLPCPDYVTPLNCATVDSDGLYIAEGNWLEPTPEYTNTTLLVGPSMIAPCQTPGCPAVRCTLVCPSENCTTACSPCFEQPVALSDTFPEVSSNCSLCITGYQGRLCSRCESSTEPGAPRRYRSGTACIHCNNNNLPISFGIIGAIVVVAIIAYFVLRRLKLSGILKTLIFFVQTRQALQSTEQQQVIVRFGEAEFVNFDIQGLECLVPALEPGSWKRQLFVMMTPLVVLGLLILIALVIHICRQYICREQCRGDKSRMSANKLQPLGAANFGNFSNARVSKVLSLLAKAIVTVALLAYFSESTFALNMLRCEPEAAAPPGKEPRAYLVMYPWQTCDRGDANYAVVWRLSAIAIVIYTVAIPIISAILLFVNRAVILAGDKNVERWLGGLYDSYKPDYFWFELLYFARKVLLAVFIALLEGTPRTAAVLGLLQVAIVIQLLLKPFAGRLQNGLETFALVALSWNYSTSAVAGLAGDVYVGIVCLVLDGTVLLGFVIAFLRPLYFKIKEKCCALCSSKDKTAAAANAADEQAPLFSESDDDNNIVSNM